MISPTVKPSSIESMVPANCGHRLGLSTASFFYSYLVLQSMKLIWSSRNMEDCYKEEKITLSTGVKSGGEIVNTKRI